MSMKMFRFLLFPFGVLYFLVTYIRNKFYDFNIFKSTKKFLYLKKKFIKMMKTIEKKRIDKLITMNHA